MPKEKIPSADRCFYCLKSRVSYALGLISVISPWLNRESF